MLFEAFDKLLKYCDECNKTLDYFQIGVFPSRDLISKKLVTYPLQSVRKRIQMQSLNMGVYFITIEGKKSFYYSFCFGGNITNCIQYNNNQEYLGNENVIKRKIQ